MRRAIVKAHRTGRFRSSTGLSGPCLHARQRRAYHARVAPFNVNYRYVADELVYLLSPAVSTP